MSWFDFFVLLFIFSFFSLIFLWLNFNAFITKQNQVKEDFSDIDIQLKRRATLIEQLVEVVKGYAKHEKEVFEKVAQARSRLDTSKTIKEIEKAENLFSTSLRSIIAVVENYPKLKANESYKNLMDNIKETEDRIARYREEYNQSVKNYNNSIQIFPNMIAARIFAFLEEEFFKVKTVEINNEPA